MHKIDINNKVGEIRLGANHSIITGHKPNIVTPELFVNQIIKENNTCEIESFGLWETATPNYATYYPEVTQDDLKPKEDEFIEPVFRLLSETIVSKGRPIDFSKPGVLKKSMKMLLGQTVNIDHEVAVGNAIGAVSQVFWQDSYKSKSGKLIPAGINGVLKIDGKSNPRIARGIMMEPPSIHSNSVTVRFKWEPSHTYEDIYEFYNKLGTYDDKGNLHRLVVTEIVGYSETSLVSHGADTYAQKVNEAGEIVNPEYASREAFSSNSLTVDTGDINISYDYKDIQQLSKGDITTPLQTNNNNESKSDEKDMKKLIETLTEKFSFKDGELTEANLAEKLGGLLDAKETALSTLTTEKDTLTTEKGNLETKLTTLQGELDSANLSIGAILTEKRKEAERLYSLSKGKDNIDQNIITMIQGAGMELLNSLTTTYAQEVDEKFKPTCKGCGGHKISMASGITDDDGTVDLGKGGKDGEGKTKTNAEVMESFKSKKKSSIALSAGESSNKS